jgi:hypothetical protein
MVHGAHHHCLSIYSLWMVLPCWFHGYGSWCLLLSPSFLIFIVEIALLVSWLWFFMFITITFFFAPFSHGHLIDLMIWLLTFITIVVFICFP